MEMGFLPLVKRNGLFAYFYSSPVTDHLCFDEQMLDGVEIGQGGLFGFNQLIH